MKTEHVGRNLQLCFRYGFSIAIVYSLSSPQNARVTKVRRTGLDTLASLRVREL
jgi:hypothetical protein